VRNEEKNVATNSDNPERVWIKSEYEGRSRKNLDFHSSHEVGICAKSPRRNKSDTNFHEIWIFSKKTSDDLKQRQSAVIENRDTSKVKMEVNPITFVHSFTTIEKYALPLFNYK